MKKRLKALGIKYIQDSHKAPFINAKGEGIIAEKILEIARENGIPIEKDSDMFEILYSLDLGSEIPEEAYEVIAEILAMVVMMKNETGSFLSDE